MSPFLFPYMKWWSWLKKHRLFPLSPAQAQLSPFVRAVGLVRPVGAPARQVDMAVTLVGASAVRANE